MLYLKSTLVIPHSCFPWNFWNSLLCGHDEWQDVYFWLWAYGKETNLLIIYKTNTASKIMSSEYM